MQDFCKEFTEKIDETQVNLQAVKTSIDTWTGSLKGDIASTKKELDLMFQVEAQTIEADIRFKQEKIETMIEAT
jgi:hypothetical protein